MLSNLKGQFKRTAAAIGLAATVLPASASLVGMDLDGDNTTAEAFFDTATNKTWFQTTEISDYTDTVAAVANFYGFSGGQIPVYAELNSLFEDTLGNAAGIDLTSDPAAVIDPFILPGSNEVWLLQAAGVNSTYDLTNGTQLTYAANAGNTAAGFGYFDGRVGTVVVGGNEVPEPSTFGLAGVAALAAAAALRRRRENAPAMAA